MAIAEPPGRASITEGPKIGRTWMQFFIDLKTDGLAIGSNWLLWFSNFKKAYNNLISGIVASRLVAADADSNLDGVDDLTDWVAASNGITITDDGDGTITIGQNTPSQGSLHADDVATDMILAAQNTWYQVVAFDTQGNLTVNVTVSVANSDITIGSTGTQYFLTGFSLSGHGHAAHDYHFHVKKNNGATEIAQIAGSFSTPVAGQIYTISAMDIIGLNAADTVELWVQRTSAGADIVLTIDTLTLFLLETANN